MIYRSEYGPRCTHCGNVNPASIVPRVTPGPADCFHCRKPFNFWIEQLPFFCSDTKAPAEPGPDVAGADNDDAG